MSASGQLVSVEGRPAPKLPPEGRVSEQSVLVEGLSAGLLALAQQVSVEALVGAPAVQQTAAQAAAPAHLTAKQPQVSNEQTSSVCRQWNVLVALEVLQWEVPVGSLMLA